MISAPLDFVHEVHVGFDNETGEFSVRPPLSLRPKCFARHDHPRHLLYRPALAAAARMRSSYLWWYLCATIEHAVVRAWHAHVPVMVVTLGSL